jgi:hypothetical protein
MWLTLPSARAAGCRPREAWPEPDRTAQHAGDLHFGQVLEEPQHYDGTLACGQAAKRSPDRVAVIHLVHLAAGTRPLWRPVRGFFAAPPASPPPRHIRRDDDLPDVRFRVVVQPWPREPRLHQRRLGQILRGGPVMSQQISGTEQSRPAGRHEQRVVRPVRHGTSLGLFSLYAGRGSEGCQERTTARSDK